MTLEDRHKLLAKFRELTIKSMKDVAQLRKEKEGLRIRLRDSRTHLTKGLSKEEEAYILHELTHMIPRGSVERRYIHLVYCMLKGKSYGRVEPKHQPWPPYSAPAATIAEYFYKRGDAHYGTLLSLLSDWFRNSNTVIFDLLEKQAA